MLNLTAAITNGVNYLKRRLFLLTRSGLFTPLPQNIYLVPSPKCNAKCIICLNWLDQKSEPLPFKYWKKTINEFSEIIPYSKINISGGEVMLPEFKEIVDYSISKLPYTGITTNGFLIDKKRASSLIAKNFSNINVSLDGVTKKTVNLIRGVPFAHKNTKRAIEFLVLEKNKQHSRTKIILKTVIMGLNALELPALVHWGEKIGVDGIYFQPIEPIYNSNQTFEQLKKSSLWIKPQQKKRALRMINQLIKLKKEGYPILNDLNHFELFKQYFGLQKGIRKTSNHCPIDLTTLEIMKNGDVFFCTRFPPIGNIKKDNIDNILYLTSTLKQRSAIRSCPKVNQCLSTCMINKSLWQQIKLFVLLNR